jgi:hypothetical protein
MQKTWVFDLGVIIVLWQHIRAILGRKVRQLRSFEPKLSLQLVQSSFANVNIMKAILGLAWAVAVPLGDDMVMGR